MKKFFVIIFAAFFVMGVMAKDFAALAWDCWYLINKEYAAKELCVNKAKPEMHCNGKCCLVKQLQKLEEQAEGKTAPTKQKNPVPHSTRSKETTWITAKESFYIITETNLPACNSRKDWPQPNRAPRSLSTPVFHPPTV